MFQVKTHRGPTHEDIEMDRIQRAELAKERDIERRLRIIAATEASLSDEAVRRRDERARQVGRRNNRGFKREARGSW